MSTDWREKEREFLTSLQADTGRDLAQWMRVIAAQNLPHRNDIIDWLRQQGFLFAKASWLERIHNNGGRPIYLTLEDLCEEKPSQTAEPFQNEIAEWRVAVAGGGGTPVIASLPSTPSIVPGENAPAPPQNKLLRAVPSPAIPAGLADGVKGAVAGSVKDETVSSGPVPSSTPATFARAAVRSSEREDVLAKGKAYRPLATHLLRMIEDAIPDLDVTPGTGHLTLGREGKIFGLIAVSSKDIRLVLKLNADCVASETWLPVKLPAPLSRAAAGMSAMAVLTDARQLNDALINCVKDTAGP